MFKNLQTCFFFFFFVHLVSFRCGTISSTVTGYMFKGAFLPWSDSPWKNFLMPQLRSDGFCLTLMREREPRLTCPSPQEKPHTTAVASERTTFLILNQKDPLTQSSIQPAAEVICFFFVARIAVVQSSVPKGFEVALNQLLKEVVCDVCILVCFCGTF